MTWFKPGDKAYGYCRRHDLQYGTYAEYVTAPEGYLAHMPAGAVLRGGRGAAAGRSDRAPGLEALGLRGGETLFISGGAGGVGHLAIQLARRPRRARDRDRLPGQPRLPPRARRRAARLRRRRRARARARAHRRRGADAAFDLFGGDGREQAFASLRRGGRLVSIARPPPEPREHFEVHYMFVRPSGYDLGEHITPLVNEGACARTCRRRSRSSAPPRRWSASRRGTCAASSSSPFPKGPSGNN